MMQPSDSDTRHLPPDPKGSRALQGMVDGSQEVTTDTKQIQHDAVHRQEPLRQRSRGDLRIGRSRWRVGWCDTSGPIVLVLLRAVHH